MVVRFSFALPPSPFALKGSLLRLGGVRWPRAAVGRSRATVRVDRSYGRAVPVFVDGADAHEVVVDGDVLQRVRGHLAGRADALPLVARRLADDDLVVV